MDESFKCTIQLTYYFDTKVTLFVGGLDLGQNPF